MSVERIISGDEVHLPQGLPGLPKGWEGAFVFDPNLENTAHPSEDVLAWLISNQWALLMVLDGVTKGKPGSPSANYNSGPVAIRFAKEAMTYARPHLEASTSFDLWQMHEHAGSRIQSARQSEETMPEGGLVGVSTLLLPDGQVRMHRFGDPEPALSTDPQNPERLEVPKELWPENRARAVYLEVEKLVAEGSAQWGAFGQTEERCRGNILIPPRDMRNVTRHASTTHGLATNDQDHGAQLPEEGSLVKGSDGLIIYKNLESIQRWTTLPIEEMLNRIYKYAKTESRDNISGFGIRRKS